MCAPQVMSHVHSELSRRDHFRLAGGAGGSGRLAKPGGGAKRSLSTQRAFHLNNFADLSHTLSERSPVYYPDEPMKITTLFTVEKDGFYVNRWDLSEHSGTHLDAPRHFGADRLSAEEIPLTQLIVTMAVIDISERAAADPEAMVTVDDVMAYEGEHGELPENTAVMMYSGWDIRFDDPESFLNADEAGVMRLPGFSPEAAEFLVRERRIAGIGVDTISLDVGSSTSFQVHVSVLGANKWGLENVANLGHVPAAGAYLIVGGPKVQGASGGPARLIAAWE